LFCLSGCSFTLASHGGWGPGDPGSQRLSRGDAAATRVASARGHGKPARRVEPAARPTRADPPPRVGREDPPTIEWAGTAPVKAAKPTIEWAGAAPAKAAAKPKIEWAGAEPAKAAAKPKIEWAGEAPAKAAA